MATWVGVEHVVREWLVCSDADLLLDELTAHDFLGDGVFHLDTRIHLHEVEVLGLLIDKVFDGSGVFVTDGGDQLDGGFCHLLTELLGN